jgi:hypothetical protein
MMDFKTAQVQRHHQNIERYCRLLATELSGNTCTNGLQKSTSVTAIGKEPAQTGSTRASVRGDKVECRNQWVFLASQTRHMSAPDLTGIWTAAN